MTAGKETVLKLHPEGLSTITFEMTGGEGGGSQSGCIVLVGSLDLGLGKRKEIAYSQGSKMDGGGVANSRGPLVDVTFDVIVSDTSRAAMIQRAETLIEAVTNPDGGTVEWKPDGLGAGVPSTYIHYLESPPPELKKRKGNRWDAPARGGVYRLVLTVRLTTQPFVTTDPDSPTAVLPETTLDNTDDATRDNYVTVPEANLKGSEPALIRLKAQPVTGGIEVSRLLVALRTQGLANFVGTYNSASFLAPSSAWSTETDAARSGGSFYRCTPAATGHTYGLRYTIGNWADHRGRAAVIVSVRDNSAVLNAMEVWAAWTIANTPLAGEAKFMPSVGEWRLRVLAEFDVPETEMSAVEDLDLYIDVYVRRISGSGTIDVDCLNLLYTDEGIIEVTAPDDVGALTTQDILVENLEEELAHIVTHADGKLQYVCNLIGPPGLIPLQPGGDNRLDVLFERKKKPVFTDDFQGYGDYFAKIASMEADENWVFTAGSSTGAQTDHFSEGSQAIGGSASAGSHVTAYLNGSWDLGDYSDYDLIYLWVYSAETTGDMMTVKFHTVVNSDYFSAQAYAGLGFLKKKGDFAKTGSPDWSNIVRIEIDSYDTDETRAVRWDDLRIVVANPTDPTKDFETGGAWDFYWGDWHVQELDGADKKLGTPGPDSDAYVPEIALVADGHGDDVRLQAKVRGHAQQNVAFDKMVGLCFRVSDATYLSEDGYAFFLEFVNQRAYLCEWTAGAKSNVTYVSYPCSEDTDYWLGVVCIGTSIKCYVSLSLSTLWDAASKVIDETDSTHTTGESGAITYDCGARFEDFRLEGVADRHLPADQVKLSAWAVFRGLLPFAE
jgi:hypothetical protein